MLTLIYDTETSGLPDWKQPSDAPHQPHLVEVAALLVTPDHEIVHSLSLIVRPEGWTIDPEVAALHGIDQARAEAIGIPEADALAAFMALWRICQVRVGFNEQFDARIMRIALKRYRPEEAEAFKAGFKECAMYQAQKVLGGKWPKLADAYAAIVGTPLEGAHSAYADALATAKLHKRLKERLACSSAT